jgi:dTDP-4-dehydrorhamnose reductase
MKLVVVGCRGMLGSDLVEACAAAGGTATGLDLPEFDLTDPGLVESALPAGDWVINCAAYTRVDDAECEKARAYAVNADGAGHLARACAARGAVLLHLSTDYIFDGRARKACAEEDPPNPLNAYGASKLAGEQRVRDSGCAYLIVRTQSLFGRRGPNFVRSVAEKLRAGGGPLRVVNDQVSSPTYTRHLAAALLNLVGRDCRGVVHVANSGACTWFEFARAIADRVKPGAGIEPIRAEELARPAIRPAYSVLDTGRYRAWTGATMPPWQDGLEAYLKEERLA